MNRPKCVVVVACSFIFVIMNNKKIIIRDLRSKAKFVVDDLYINGYARFVGPYATCVYNSLCRHANKIQKSWPSIQTIADQHGIGRNSVINGIKKLEFWKIIHKDRIGKKANNRYNLLDKSCWIDISEVSLKDFSEVYHINFTSLSDKLQGFTRRTSIVRKHISKETQRKDTYSEEFLLFWDQYPKKISKPDAFKAFNRVSKANTGAKLLELIIKDLKIRAKTADWLKEKGKYIPYPATYLNQRRWEDEDKGQPPIKKPFFRGDPMVKVNGKFKVIIDGDFKDFAGDEKDIEYKEDLK